MTVSPTARSMAHQIARHELDLERDAKQALEKMHSAAAVAAGADRELLEAARQGGAVDDSLHVTEMSKASLNPTTLKSLKSAQFTKTSTLSRDLKAEAAEAADFKAARTASAAGNKPVFWRCVVELLHVTNLGSRAEMRRPGGTNPPVAVELRLFSQTITTSTVLPSPPITLLDFNHTIFIKARQSNLRRYFFTSPKAHISLLQDTGAVAEPGELAPAAMVPVGKGTLNIEPLLKKGFFEADVDVPFPGQKAAAKVHIALWMERLMAEEEPTDFIKIGGY